MSIDVAAIDRLNALLDVSDDSTTATSMRLPAAIRDAASLAVERLGAAPSITTLTVDALRFTLETVAMEAALEAHYDQHPDARPSLAELALAAAAQDGHPLAGEPELIERAARDIVERHSDADFEDVLLWAEALGGGSGVAGA